MNNIFTRSDKHLPHRIPFSNRKGSNNPVSIVMPNNILRYDLSSRNQYIPSGAHTSSVQKQTAKSFIQPSSYSKVSFTSKNQQITPNKLPASEIHSRSFIAPPSSNQMLFINEQKKYSPLIQRNPGAIPIHTKRQPQPYNPSSNQKRREKLYIRKETTKEARIQNLKNEIRQNADKLITQPEEVTNQSVTPKDQALSKYFKGQISYTELNQMKKQQLSSILNYLKTSQDKVSELPNFGQNKPSEQSFLAGDDDSANTSLEPQQIVEVVDIIDDEEIKKEINKKQKKNQFSFGGVQPTFYEEKVNFILKPEKKQEDTKVKIQSNQLHLSNSSDAFNYLTRQFDSLAMTPNFLKSPSHNSIVSKQYEEMATQNAKNKLSQSSDEIAKAVNVFFEQKKPGLGDYNCSQNANNSHNNNINFIFYQPTHVVDKRKVVAGLKSKFKVPKSPLPQNQGKSQGVLRPMSSEKSESKRQVIQLNSHYGKRDDIASLIAKKNKRLLNNK